MKLSDTSFLQAAITHYINGGMPALAVPCIIRNKWQGRLPAEVLESLLAKLTGLGLHESAAELYEYLRRYDEAIAAYSR